MSWRKRAGQRLIGLLPARSKDRINLSLHALRATLPESEVIVWYDWKQNITLPLARVQTADQFYGTARMEVTCFGALVQRGAVTKCFVYVTDIIEHSALFTAVILNEIRGELAFRGVDRVHFWSDCGPHFRAYEH